jgi:hypothetical protein
VVETFGYRNIVSCRVPGAGLLQSVSPPEMKLTPKDTAWLQLTADHIHLFAPNGAAISHPVPTNGKL